MKKLLTSALVAVSFAVAAQNVPPAPMEKPPARVHATKGISARHQRNGGLVTRITKEGGVLRFIDLRGDKATDLGHIIHKMPQFFSIAVDAAKGEKKDGDCPMTVAKKTLGKEVAVAVVISCEGAGSPSLVVCPEDRMAVINADRLMQDLPAEGKDEAFDVRLTKEMWRAVAFTMAGYASDYPCVMKPVASVADLDGNPLQMTCPPVSGKVAAAAEKYGVAQMQTAPYVIAVRQGWAPAPTNDIQKAIWDAVKAEKEAKAKAEAAKAAPPAPAK